jgi:hypothetical protein
MGLLLEVTGYYALNPGAVYTAMTPLTGDSLSVRTFNVQNPAYIHSLDREGATKGVLRVRSPRLHDNVKGIHLAASETPTLFGIPPYNNQTLYPQDTLIAEITGGAAEYDVGLLGIYYTNLPGSGARLHSWGDISGIIQYFTTVEVAVTVGTTPVAWTDTVITTTDNLLRANTDYAVLGYTVDTALAAVAIKGADTSNFRVGGPGKILVSQSADYFVRMSNATGRACIPVFNSANQNNTYISAFDAGASTVSNVTLFLACLAQNLAPASF